MFLSEISKKESRGFCRVIFFYRKVRFSVFLQYVYAVMLSLPISTIVDPPLQNAVAETQVFQRRSDATFRCRVIFLYRKVRFSVFLQYVYAVMLSLPIGTIVDPPLQNAVAETQVFQRRSDATFRCRVIFSMKLLPCFPAKQSKSFSPCG